MHSNRQNPTSLQKAPSNQIYVLMTAAHNEEDFIEKTIRSVLSQTVLPNRWVIVSDNSTDRTDEIVEGFAKQHEFIHFLKLTRPAGRNFGLKGMALQSGMQLLAGLSFEFIGNLDADVTIEPLYFETLMNHFERDPKLGIAAGFIYEEEKGEFRSRAANRTDSVSHAGQLVRRECYGMIGGYSIFKYGGEDWYAQQCAKMNGWHAEAIPTLPVFHQRHTGAANKPLRHQFRSGRVDYSFGSDPVFEFLKCAVRVPERPWLVGAVTRFLGFVWSSVSREKRPVSQEFIDFLRKEQRAKVLSVFRGAGRERLRVQTP